LEAAVDTVANRTVNCGNNANGQVLKRDDSPDQTYSALLGWVCIKSALLKPFHLSAGVNPSRFWCGRAWL
jgi:hypothetical protein